MNRQGARNLGIFSPSQTELETAGADCAAILVDFDGTLYRQTPMRLLMAAELLLFGAGAIGALRVFRREQERLRSLSVSSSASTVVEVSPFQRQLVNAATAAGMEGLHEFLSGPTALTFVSGDVAAAAKALDDHAKTNPLLVIKGGQMGESTMSADDVKTLASLPSREVLLAQIAGAFQAPLVKTAGLLQALPRNFAYGLNALIEQRAAA